MATLLLRAAGTAIGGLFGPVGAAIGAAIGSVAGYTIDQALLNSTRHIEGSRLSGARPMSAEDGTPIPRIYGYARVTSTVIWATEFEEKKTTERQGAKGGPSVTSYSYYGNMALGLCEGKIAGIKRVWADGKELDLRDVEYRVYLGDEEQLPDSLIDAKQGEGNAPAYRGIAYIVFERLPLERFGNRLPQIQVEIIRPVGKLEESVRAVTILPGATEHGLNPNAVTIKPAKGSEQEINRHILFADSDWHGSIDELQAVFPNLEHVSLVVSWYCDDLRAGEAKIRPGVTSTNGQNESVAWEVSGLSRTSNEVRVVSQIEGRAAYGGTPSDKSVIDAILDLKSRGLRVTLNPFILMDIASGNALADPYGNSEQNAFPWRGRITCFPAIGQPSSADKTTEAKSQIDGFVGSIDASSFTRRQTTVESQVNEFSYRRFILHYAHLVQLAGGVDTFIIGSEMRGLTTVRDHENVFPFVTSLKNLASDIGAIVSAETNIIYGADWSEYFGYHPQDGSGDVYFHLDALWSDDNISAIGIDNYMPISDWRETDNDSAVTGFDGAYYRSDINAFKNGIASGEGYDWYYASVSDRANRTRTPIADGAYDKPWVFRYKDLKSWWENEHFERLGGIESADSTEWQPQSKQFWMMEIGCPAVHNGASQPNVFVDEKSDESALPYFSNGNRDDIEQRNYLQAHHEYWSTNGDSNPLSSITQQPMVDPERLYIWAWDARPYPAFPLNQDYWGDGENWMRGHWLNGRMGTAPAADIIEKILFDHGTEAAQTQMLHGATLGLIIANPSSARGTLEPLLQLFSATANDMNIDADDAFLSLRNLGHYEPIEVPIDHLIDVSTQPLISKKLSQATELPGQIVLNYRDPMNSYASSTYYSRRIDEASAIQIVVDAPSVMEHDHAAILADQMLGHQWAGRMSAQFGLPISYCDLSCGDVVNFEDASDQHWLIERITLTDYVAIDARMISKPKTIAHLPSLPNLTASDADQGYFGSAPEFITMDLPLISDVTPNQQLRVASYSSPKSTQLVYLSPSEDGYALRQTIDENATIGVTANALPASFSGRWDYGTYVDVTLISGAFESQQNSFVLAGNNSIAIRSDDGSWEILQFANAVEIAPDTWRLSRVLRGQLGTEDAMMAGISAGADVVLLNEAVVPVGISTGEIGLELNMRIGPSGKEFTDRYFETASVVGGLRSQLPLAPVHLDMRIEGDAYIFSWVRRSRVEADSWLSIDIPLGEDAETYQLALLNNADEILVSAESSENTFIIMAAELQAAAGGTPTSVKLRVAQLSQQVGEGIPAIKTFSIQ